MAEQGKFKVEFSGEGQVDVREGETILEAALNAGIPHFHACGGNAECSTCRVIVMEGRDQLTPVSPAEQRLRTIVPFPPKIRLACQTSVTGPGVKVQRIKVEKTGLSWNVKQQINDVQQKLGEKRQLALFFLDIRNFTPFVETFLPFDVIHVLQSCYVIFNHWIEAHGGVIVDTAGDGFYAVFGLESGVADASRSAIHAGQEILKELDRFNDTFLDPYFGNRLEIGIGVHAGSVIVGEIMVGDKSHLSVMGLAVNIAARIQASTRRLNNNFLASQDVMDYVETDASTPLRVVKLRGVTTPVKVRLIGQPYIVMQKNS